MELTKNLELISKDRVKRSLQMVTGYETLANMFKKSSEQWCGELLVLKVDNTKHNTNIFSLMNREIVLPNAKIFVKIFGGPVLNDKRVEKEIDLVTKYFKAEKENVLIAVFEDCNISTLGEVLNQKVIKIPGLKSNCWEPYYSKIDRVISLKGRKAQ